MPEIVLDLLKTIDSKIRGIEVQQTPSTRNLKTIIAKPMAVKLWKTSDKKRNLNGNERKKIYTENKK